MNPFQSLSEYEAFAYTLQQRHHKHVPPDIKHNRIPAPQMSFAQPNLPVLIQEIEVLVKQ